MSIHIGIIPDGNRRWCKRNNKNRFEYATMAQHMICKFFEEYKESTLPYPIGELSMYILSKDNIEKRDKSTLDLVDKTMDIIGILFSSPFLQDKINLDIIGDTTILPLILQEKIQKCVAFSNGPLPIHLAIGYDPVKDTMDFLEKGFHSRTQMDLVIRSGGQLRSSGFFPLQTLYSEWVYFDELWPDMTKKHIESALETFSNRQRNFGK